LLEGPFVFVQGASHTVLRLLDQLFRRKKRVPELLLGEAFAVWTAKMRPLIQ
jgi:hypothetical protein